MMRENLILILKGMAMGIANVIPGVSGGTIALVTQIYERLINSLKSFDRIAFKLILKRNIVSFRKHTDLDFLLSVLIGSVISVFSIASLFEYLFNKYPIYIWSFFFGLIIASIYFVGKRIEKWNIKIATILILGTITAISLGFITPANSNDDPIFVFICGIIGISGMMLPGLSGSFILILMGNYELLMVEAITNLDIKLLSIFGIGSIFGLIFFSHILAWVLKKHKDATLALLTGFIIGSLNIIWPWKQIKKAISTTQTSANIPALPAEYNQETLISIFLMLMGFLIVYMLENIELQKKK